jgi:hypothetical protein
MDKLKQLSLAALADYWQTGKLSITELLAGLLPQLLTWQETQTNHDRQLSELAQAYLALNLTVYQLKAEVDSLKLQFR